MSQWKSPPKTFSAAMKRIDLLELKLHYAEEDQRSSHEWGMNNAEEVGRLGRLLTYRAKVGDATASCKHPNTEVGKLSGNVYCSDCQEILASQTPNPQTGASSVGAESFTGSDWPPSRLCAECHGTGYASEPLCEFHGGPATDHDVPDCAACIRNASQSEPSSSTSAVTTRQITHWGDGMDCCGQLHTADPLDALEKE